jgi:cell volume regulation protein A
MEAAHQFILIGGALGVVAIFAGLFAARIGTPLLLVFLLLGMLAGEDGPGGIRFDDFAATYRLGSLALVVILFEGGLKTSLATLRAVFRPALALATVGVAITAGVVGAATVALSGQPWGYGLLLGALVAPTDAAAVAAVLRASRVAVPDRVIAVLEVESGLNDPMSVFLTLLLVEIILLPHGVSGAQATLLFVREMGGGAVLGLAAGGLLARAMRLVKTESGLLPVLLLSAGWAVFGAAQQLGTSGFLAVYIAGAMAGRAAGERLGALERAFEAFAWVAQIGLFLMLGLLITPHDMLPLALPAAVVAAALILVARPLAALVCLRPFGFGWGETGFVAWVGLRGAVPIYLAIIPVLEGVPNGELGFAAAFLIVLLSLAVQGWTIGPMARLLRLSSAASAPRGGPAP